MLYGLWHALPGYSNGKVPHHLLTCQFRTGIRKYLHKYQSRLSKIGLNLELRAFVSVIVSVPLLDHIYKLTIILDTLCFPCLSASLSSPSLIESETVRIILMPVIQIFAKY